MKRIALTVVIMISFIGIAAAAFAQKEIYVIIDGKLQEYPQPPIILNGRTLVPLREIFESLGAEVDWEASTSTVFAKKDNISLSLQINNKDAVINGKVKKLDVEPQLINGKTMVPARFVAEALGAVVKWDQNSNTVIIYSQGSKYSDEGNQAVEAFDGAENSNLNEKTYIKKVLNPEYVKKQEEVLKLKEELDILATSIAYTGEIHYEIDEEGEVIGIIESDRVKEYNEKLAEYNRKLRELNNINQYIEIQEEDVKQ